MNAVVPQYQVFLHDTEQNGLSLEVHPSTTLMRVGMSPLGLKYPRVTTLCCMPSVTFAQGSL